MASSIESEGFGRVLDPMERISETLFGLIMALTFICSLGVASAGSINIETMLIGASLTAVFICGPASMTRDAIS